jgi:uncharacterized repeat protein (TIGR02543 family)
VRSKTFALAAVALMMASVGITMMPDVSAGIFDDEIKIPGHTGNYVLEGTLKKTTGIITLHTLQTGGAIRDVVIPSEYGGYPISSFTETMFRSNPYVSSILIKAGIDTIPNKAFMGCTALTSVVVEPGISELPYYAFRDCTALTSVTIPSSVTHIGVQTFAGCTALTSITMPGSLATLDAGAFSDCTSLRSVTFQGNAPDHSASGENPLAVNSPLTVYYNPGVSGFTTPTWFGVPCKPLYTTISFDSVGGSFVPSRQVMAGDPYGTLPTPTKAGYTFQGWYDGATRVTASTVPTKDVTLKAQWSANNIQYTAPPDGNLAVGTYWSHQMSTTPGIVITVSGAGTSWIQVNGGTVSGIPPSAGVYEVSVLLTAPNYISQSKSFTLNVVPQLVLTNSPAAGAIAYVVG